ncbi:MAG TPA: hypothetical protein VLA12_06280 [Planctomycetaceae bacterium]|nr:hypothetical protein [Planctomycetaceae bacterium]
MIQSIRQNSNVLLFFTMLFVWWGPVILRAELPDFVREDVGLCLHVREIPAWTEEIKNSEIRTRLEAAPFFQRWKSSGNYTGLKTTIRELEKLLGRPLSDVLRSTFGQEILLAVYPDAGEKPAGVLMSRPANREQTQELIDLWNRLEEADVVPVDDRYMRRTSPKGPQLFYVLRDELFAMSDREELIAELAELGPAGFENSLAQSVRWNRAIESLEQTNWAIAYFQPDRWKNLLTIQHRDPFEKAFFEELGRLESLAAGIEGKDGLHARFNLLYPAGREPESLRHFRERAGESPANWSELTSRTILIAAGRSDPGYLAEVLKRQAPKSRETLAAYEVLRGLLLGRDPLDEVLPHVGRHWHYSIVSQPDRIAFPWDLRLRLDLEELPSGNSANRGAEAPARPDLHTSLQNLVRTLVRIGGLFLSEPLASRSQLFSETLPNGATIDGFETVLGLSPAIGIGNGQLVVSNSRPLVERELTNSEENPESLALSGRLAPLASKCCLGMYLNLKELRASLSAHAEAVLRLLKKDESQLPDAKRRLEQQLQVLSLFDSAYLFGTLSKELVSVHFGIESLPDRDQATSSVE